MKTHVKNLKGMSLVEMMIAIAILVIGMGGFSLLFLTSFRHNAFLYEIGAASSAAARGVSTIVEEVRKVRQADNGDYPVESGDDFDFMAYIDIDGDGVTERVHYYLQDRQMFRGITDPLATQPVTYPNGDQTTEVIARNVDNEASEPVFTYFTAAEPTTPLSTPITASDVRIVGIRLFVNLYPNRAPEDVSIESLAELRNLNTYVQ